MGLNEAHFPYGVTQGQQRGQEQRKVDWGRIRIKSRTQRPRVLTHLRKGRKSTNFDLFMRDTDVQFSFVLAWYQVNTRSEYELKSISFKCSPFQKRLYRVGK